MSIDEALYLWINGLAGKIRFFDELFRGLANDYFIIVSTCLILLVLWFGTRDEHFKWQNQFAVIGASISLGISQVLVNLCNSFYFRSRPFTDLPVNLVFYRPTDSSFPSNAATLIFAVAMAVFIINRKAGFILFALAVIHGFSRVYVGIHYPLDILGGAAIGILTALAVYSLVKPQKPFIMKCLKALEKYQVT